MICLLLRGQFAIEVSDDRLQRFDPPPLPVDKEHQILRHAPVADMASPPVTPTRLSRIEIEAHDDHLCRSCAIDGRSICRGSVSHRVQTQDSRPSLSRMVLGWVWCGQQSAPHCSQVGQMLYSSDFNPQCRPSSASTSQRMANITITSYPSTFSTTKLLRDETPRPSHESKSQTNPQLPACWRHGLCEGR